MNNTVLFHEKQRFTQWWVWLLLIGVLGFHTYIFIQQIVYSQPVGNRPMSDTGLYITNALVLLFTLLFLVVHLETKITKDKIVIRFFPFHFKEKQYPFDSINKSYIRTYSPISEYGGWGIRIGLFGKGKAYNISGNQGLQLEFNNEKKLLIGTQKPEELKKVLSSIGQLKE